MSPQKTKAGAPRRVRLKRPIQRRIKCRTEGNIRQAARVVLRQLDAMLASRKETALKDATVRGTQINLTSSEIMNLTRGACWRPDLYLKANRHCDLCSLYQWCLNPVKRVKVKNVQGPDLAAAYLAEQARILAAQRPAFQFHKRIKRVIAFDKVKV